MKYTMATAVCEMWFNKAARQKEEKVEKTRRVLTRKVQIILKCIGIEHKIYYTNCNRFDQSRCEK